MNRCALYLLRPLGLCCALALASCAAGGPATPPASSPAPAPVAAAEPEPAAQSEPEAEPDARGGEQPEPALKRRASGRPAATFDSASGEIASTFGATPASVLRLSIKESVEPMVLVIPEWALPTGYNITWKLATKGPAGQRPQHGPMFQSIVQEAGKAEVVRVDSSDPPFEFRVPLFGRDTVNLAVGEIEMDDKGKERVAWKVFAPASVDKGLGHATFRVPFLGHCYVHATGAAPTVAAEPND